MTRRSVRTKNGSQQATKAPVIIANVLAAFFSRFDSIVSRLLFVDVAWRTAVDVPEELGLLVVVAGVVVVTPAVPADVPAVPAVPAVPPAAAVVVAVPVAVIPDVTGAVPVTVADVVVELVGWPVEFDEFAVVLVVVTGVMLTAVDWATFPSL